MNLVLTHLSPNSTKLHFLGSKAFRDGPNTSKASLLEGRRTRSTVCRVEKNPQNTDRPQVFPEQSFSAEESVIAQLEALSENCTPWYNHGIQVMYEFGADVGGLDPCYYFGFRKDLYHFDHFMGEFGNRFEEIIDHKGFKLLPSPESAQNIADREIVHANVTTKRDGTVQLLKFTMKKKDIGRYKGCYMTERVQIEDSTSVVSE